MISEKLLDKLIPVPDKFEEAEKIRQKLEKQGFQITYWENGWIFKTIIMIFLLIYEEIVQLLRSVLYNSYLATAEKDWLDVKANDLSRQRKKATKTEGWITLHRSKIGQMLTIPKGYIFKTDADSGGNEMRFLVEEEQYIQSFENTAKIKVVAEHPGEAYNLSENKIVKSLQHIEGITSIRNEKGWIIREGSNEENDESFRERTMDWYDELAQLPTAAKLRAIALSVPGVVQCYVNDLHPRGQGTIDIILIGSAGVPTQNLKDEVQAKHDEVKGPYDDILYIDPVEQEIDVNATILIEEFADEENLKKLATEAILKLLEKQKGKVLNHLYKAQITSTLMNISGIKNVTIVQPTEDVITNNKTILKLRNTNITVQRK